MSSREQRVLVLAPTGRDASLTCALLSEGGLAAEACPSIEDLCRSISEGAGVLLIAEEALPPSAVQLLGETLDHQPPWSDIPVIVLAGGEFSASSLRPLNLLGPVRNIMILERPVRRLILIRSVAVALRARGRQYELRRHLEERSALLDRERAARAEAERVNRMKDEFVMTVSHELRTPLTAIYGWARMLVTGQIRDEHKQRAIETIERNAHAQTQLVNDLLDVSRAISGKIRLDIRSVDLPAVISAAVDSIQPAADAKGIQVATDLDPAAGPISGDAARLQQIVWNLLSNAIKFTPRDGRVEIRLARHDGHIEIVVSDTGVGIAPEFAPYAFDRFRQGDAGTTRQYGGLGLGLAIVRHLAELHGGTVSAESRGAGCGATFRVVLPLGSPRKENPRLEDIQGIVTDPSATIGRLDGLRVLVVDDESHARELFRTIIENAGAETRQAASAPDALATLAAWWPDVLLSDVEMPEEDGYVLMAHVKELTGDDRPPIVAIAVTAHSRAEDRRRALESGFKMHLPKPIEPSELVAVIASLAGGHDTRHEADRSHS
jgi:signal transduction histidine kinase/ActR/RegA family two-component response regulator